MNFKYIESFSLERCVESLDMDMEDESNSIYYNFAME